VNVVISTYKRTTYLRHVAACPHPSDHLAPGDLVRHIMWKDSLGLVIGVLSDEIGVLWSRTDEEMRALDDVLEAIRQGM